MLPYSPTAPLEGEVGIKISVKSTSPSPPRPRTGLSSSIQSPVPLRAIRGINQSESPRSGGSSG
jgi:hypothetical protein